MKKLATRAAVIATVAFSIFLGGGGLAPEQADARMPNLCGLEVLEDETPGQGSPFCIYIKR